MEAPPLGAVHVRVPERLGGRRAAYMVSAGRLDRLPAGAGFDVTTGEFRWQPGEGFAGDYHFVVIERDGGGSGQVQPLEVRILPKAGGSR